MNSYRVTTPKGHSTTCDANPAYVAWFLEHYAAVGWSIELIGPSTVTIVND